MSHRCIGRGLENEPVLQWPERKLSCDLTPSRLRVVSAVVSTAQNHCTLRTSGRPPPDHSFAAPADSQPYRPVAPVHKSSVGRASS
jgi:hypothetical protein